MGRCGDLMGAISESDELDIFTTTALINLVDYKWEAFA